MLALLLAASLGAPEILAKVGENATETARIRHKQGWTGIKHETKHDISDPNVLPLMREAEWELTTVPDAILARLVKVDWLPITDAPVERPKIDFVAYLGTKYHVRMASPEPVDGYYVLAFEPKDPFPPLKGTSDEAVQEAIINRLSGVVYVDQHHFFIRRIIGSLRKGFSVATIGRVLEATVLVEQDFIDGLPTPTRSVFEVRSSKLFGFGFKSAVRVTVNYRWSVPTTETTPSPQ